MIEDHSVLNAVFRVAGLQQGTDDEFAIRWRKRLLWIGLAAIVFGGCLVEHGRHEPEREIGVSGANGRVAGNDAVEIRWIALRHDHRLAPARGAAVEIRMLRRPPIIRGNHLFRQLCHPSNCYVVEIQRGLLIAEKAAVEYAALVAGIGSDYGKSSREGRLITHGLQSQRRGHVAIQPAPSLEQESSVPFIRQRESESDAILLSVGPVRLSITPSTWQYAGSAIGGAPGEFGIL